MSDTTPSVPQPAKTGAIAVAGLDLQEGKVIPRRWVAAWAFWDWGGAAFNAVITTFVFTVYLTSSYFVSPGIVAARDAEKDTAGAAHRAYTAAEASLTSQLGFGLAIAGIVVALIAPVLGQRTDASGRRKLWLAINTGVVVVITALMFFVEGKPAFFLLGVALVCVGTVFYEIATVNYNAMLVQVSTPKTVGKVSGLGWGAGYLGGIVLLLIVLLGLVGLSAGSGGLFGVSHDDGLNIRLIAVIAAAWTLVFSLPVLFTVPEISVAERRVKVGFFQSYVVLVRDISRLWKESRNTVYFLIASALFRDGLVGVFTFGGILAQGTFGFSSSQVIIFAIAANVVAGVSTFISGLFDDRFGAKPVIVVSLIGLLVSGLGVFFAHDGGQTAFWIGGLLLCLFVGPAQSASRSFLARVTPAGREGEVFGLYATTGRAVSFLAPLLFSAFVAIAGAQYWGILGIMIVLLAGLLLLIPVRAISSRRSE
ncbi:MFS transporter [Lacisediminihabitans changchengi]|uniref:MFS transporter n=1 Tax=Lacisediminihabitans changchengi TaxID=2787634 RepID=A0A934SV68_9MICO|nr:MFS transporter [Lacisediminihabitans changchengi]MBK4348629.1 MFS transporter [Lacisediminihabitans changchengi]